jgi:hypothetical protein
MFELQQCYNAAMIVNKVLGDNNGFQSVLYWSSTESLSDYAWAQGFYSGYWSGNNYNNKVGALSVRAVRSY